MLNLKKTCCAILLIGTCVANESPIWSYHMRIQIWRNNVKSPDELDTHLVNPGYEEVIESLPASPVRMDDLADWVHEEKTNIQEISTWIKESRPCVPNDMEAVSPEYVLEYGPSTIGVGTDRAFNSPHSPTIGIVYSGSRFVAAEDQRIGLVDRMRERVAAATPQEHVEQSFRRLLTANTIPNDEMNPFRIWRNRARLIRLHLASGIFNMEE